MALRTSLVLVGMMGAGKSAVGKVIAAQLGLPFVDADVEIIKAANMSISEIFMRDGEAFFRQAESRVIDRLVSDQIQVLATGGGAFISKTVRATLQEKSVTVFLDGTAETLWERVKNSKHRPLLQTEKPRETLENLLEERRPVYLEADLVIPTRLDNSVSDTTSDVMAALHNAGYLKG